MDLQKNMENSKIHTHVSILMDGNGRWAQARGLDRSAGHAEGAESVRAVTEACIEAGVRYLSLYAFSEENWSRPEAEIKTLMGLLVQSMERELETMCANGVRIRVLGNLDRLDPQIVRQIREVEARTAANERLTFIVFLSYSGRWDLLQAVRRLAADCAADPARIETLGFADIDRCLVTDGIPDPDLLIRTSGELRLSNYLLWQSAYTEFYFTDVLWPDFRKEAFQEALEAYARRNRRYGKV